ncbi:MAG TPA: gas vesicle protein GvpG [Gaiellaceae bacterium]|nr:gas vesicle protein GvpG [Gaiellaceae bacterium]
MGFLTGILLLPLAPLRGTIWLAERLTEVAEREADDETTFRRLLVEAEIAFESGELSEAEYEQVEDELLERLELARAGASV